MDITRVLISMLFFAFSGIGVTLFFMGIGLIVNSIRYPHTMPLGFMGAILFSFAEIIVFCITVVVIGCFYSVAFLGILPC